MKNILRRLSSTAAVLAALFAAPAVLAVPTISITSPANGAALGTVSSPSGVTINASATPTGGTSIVSVDFRVNGTSIGSVAANTSPSITWTPTAAGTYTLTAFATDSGSTNNTATSSSVIVTVSAARVVTLAAPTTGTTVPTGSSFFIRSSATMTDVVVSKMDFFVNGVNVGTVNSAPYNLEHTTNLTAGTYAVFARATLTDGTTTIDSASNNLNVVAASGTAPSVTVNSPSNNSYVAVGQTVTVTAIASDTDGFISTSSGGGVTFYADGDPIGTDLTAPYSVSWTPSAAKSYSLRALAVDDKGNQTMSSVVTVTAVAAMPTVTLSAPTNNSTSSVNTAITVTASATASTGKTVTQVAFFQNGTAIGSAVTSSPYTVTYTPTSAGTYAFTAQVTDSAGISVTSAASNVTVTAAQPTVSLTAPTLGSTATVGSNVTVTATATPGTGNTVAQVQFLAGTNIIGTVTSAPYSITWTPSTTGNFSLTAKVLDSGGTTVTSSAVTVTVSAAPTVSISAPANNSAATVGTAVTVTATGSPSPGATITNISFSAGGTAIGAAVTSAPYQVAWTPSAAGSTSLTATITDSAGQTATSPAVNVVVANSQPTVSLTAPTAGAVVTLGSNVTLTATAAAGSGATVAQVQFLVGTTVVGTDTTAPYSLTWVPTTAGNQSITARVLDTNNNTVTSSVITVTAVASTSVAITAPAANSTATVGTSTTITASATPTLGATLTSVTFYATPSGGTATQIGSAVTAAPYSVAWTPSAAGAHSLTAVALDSTGASVTSTAVAVTVANSAPTITLTAPLPGAVVNAGANVTLTANAVAGSGGATVTQVQFLAGTTVVSTLAGTTGSSTYTTTWVPPSAANFNLTARVTDSNGNSTTSTAVTVTAVSPGAPSISITAPTAGALVTVGANVTLTASTSTVGGATVTQVQFLAAGAIVATLSGGSSSTYSTTWVPANAGNIALTARVTDSNGTTATSAAVNVTASSPSAPTVSLTSPVANASLPISTTTTLVASATAGTGLSIVRVEFFAGNTSLGSDLVAPYELQWTPTASGVVSLTARATDSAGNTTTSAAVLVTVSSTPGSSVTLAMLPNSTSVPVNSSRVLTATATSAAGVNSVEFYYVSGSTTTLIGSDSVPPYSAVFTAPNDIGARSLRARLIESTGNIVNSADLAINVTSQIGSAPLVGILTPSSGTFLPAGVTTTITGTATDSDGAVSNVQVLVNGSTAGLGNGGVATLSGSSWSISWTPTTTGTASISAIATDNVGNGVAAPAVGVTVTDSLSPTITLGLSPRTAAAAASTTLPSGAVRNLVADATASSGRAVVRVEFFVDGTKVGEDTVAPYTYRYVAPALDASEQSHTYVLSARATDNAGSARDVQLPVLVVSPIGVGPAVSLLTPANNASAVPGTAVTLAASATSLTGNVVSVQFYVNGSPAAVNGGNALTAAPYTTSFTPTLPGRYTIDVIATDDRGNTAISNAATIVAAFSVPTIAITAPNPNATARAIPNVPITLTAAATVQAGVGASVLLVEFLLDGVQIATRTTATNAALGTYSTTWTPTTAQIGAHVLTARVTDTNSQSATSAPVNVNVALAVGTPPTVTISTSPIPGAGLQTLSQVNFIANAFANGTNTNINNVEFFLNDLSIGLASREQTTNLYRLVYDFSRIDFGSAPVNPNNPSQYVLPLYAIARDTNNNQTVSATTNLTINAATSAPPAVSLLALTATTVTQASQILFLPQFSDSDGTVTQIQLFANGSVVQTIGNPVANQSFFTYNASTPGRFNIYAVATDDTGNTAVASPAITVQVNAVNAPATTVTRPSNDATVTTVNAPVFLEGTATASGTTLIPTLAFIATANSSGSRTQLNGIRVGTTNTYRTIWTPTVADTYTVVSQATVAGVQNTSSVSRTVVVNELIGIAPTVSISVPGTVTTTSTVNFSATASDSDGSVISVEFFVNRNSIGQAVRDQLTNTWRITAAFNGLSPGSTEVVARATDSAGNVAASGTSFINVVAASSIAPSVAVLPSTTNAAFNRQVQLRANARDTDGTVTQVQYFANGSSLGSSGNASTNYQVNWTPTASGTFNVYAVATDDTNNITVSPTVQIVVRRNNPILEDAAFILQTYQDIANTTTINPLVFDDLDSRLSSGALTRPDFVVSLMSDPSFQPPVNLIATYLVLMGQLPTPANYTSLVANARNNGLAGAVNSILFSNEYFAKFGVVPTTQLLESPTSTIPRIVFLQRLHQYAGLPPPTALQEVQFRSFNQVNANQGRGYNTVGLPTAIAEFVTNTNASNTALFNRARAAALFYQLARPPVELTVDEITNKVNALVLLPDDKARADAVLKDVLYGYRYVTITKHPASLTVAPRSGAIFTVEASGAPPLAYQWLLNGSPVPGATNSFLSLTNLTAANAGAYTVAITSSAATATSDPATLTISNVPTRLANISTRGTTSAGSNVLIGGFVVTGTPAQTRQMLIRVVGPTLSGAPFNVAGALANPSLELYTGNNRNPVLANDDWGTQAAGPAQVTAIQQAAARVGAFALPANSRDAAVLVTLAPGTYTVQANVPVATPSPSGVVLIEAYDVTQGGVAGPKAVNVSTRGFVGTGTNSLIAGFVVTGGVSRRVLIRGAGPSLAALGVPGVLADPQLTLVNQDTGATIRTNDNWGSGEDAAVIAAATATAGAFPFASNSRDAAMIVMLAPGAYTVQLSGVGNSTGVGIVEVYDVDP